jgi:phosphatidylinositol alpha-1,6-mannosyltransferase
VPTLAAITLDPTGGGVALVARLLWQVLRERHADATLRTMFDGVNHPATMPEKLAFGAALTSAQVFGRTDWVLFSHLGLAQVQNVLPSPVRRPYAVFLHGIEAWNEMSGAERLALSRATLRFSNSRYTADRVMTAHPDIGRVEPCPLALPAGTGAPRPAMCDGIGSRAVLVVGRMSASERYKGHDQLIDAWPRVLSALPDAQLVIAGGGDDAARLRQKAAASPASAAIRFTGYVDDAQLHGLYTQAAVFALPSRGEGFGLVYLEAMAAGLPCIGSTDDAAVDVIEHNKTGLLVPQADVAALAGAVARLLGDASLRRQMGDAGRARQQSVFSYAHFRERALALLAPLESLTRH